MNKHIAALALAALLVTGASSGAFAQTTDATDPGHPRVNETETRIDNQQNRVNSGVSNGTISSGQATRDDAKLNREQTSLNKDQAADNGKITKANQKHLNKRLNKGSKRIKAQKAE